MLDQNMDRFWFLIGTVMVCASIFFGIEVMFPGGMDGAMNAFADGASDNKPAEDQTYSAYKEFTVVSSGYTSPSPVSGNINDANIYNDAGKSIQKNTALGRGLEMYVFGADDKLIFHDIYDTYATGGQSGWMATKLNSFTDPATLIVVVASDSMTTNGTSHLQGGLPEAMYAKGASPEVFESMSNRETYIFIGKPGLRKGEGYELKGSTTKALKVTMPLYSAWTPLLDPEYKAK